MEDIHDLGLGETKNLGGEEVEPKASGMVKNIIANLVTGDHGGGGDVEEAKPKENSDGLTEFGAVKEENHKETGGGIINHLISSLVSPRNTPTTKEQLAADYERKSTSGVDDGGELNAAVKNEDRGTEEESEGGIINNLISNMFHHQGGRGEKESTGEKEDHKAETGRSGPVDELISNFPTHLGENAVSGPDEAFMLIHSIVHD